jgi:hypothetical protein
MFNKRTHRVAFATGILFVLTLVVFGSMIAVAWMSMNNTMAVAPDAHFTEETAALAWNHDTSAVDRRRPVYMIDRLNFESAIDRVNLSAVDRRRPVYMIDRLNFESAIDRVNFESAIDRLNFESAVDRREPVSMIDRLNFESVIDYGLLSGLKSLIA